MTKLVYADIAARVAGIANAQSSDAAGRYLEGIMESQFEKLNQKISDLESIIKSGMENVAEKAAEKAAEKVVGITAERLRELAGIAKSKD